MSSTSHDVTASGRAARPRASAPDGTADDRRLLRWGGVAGLAGVVLMLGSVVTVVSLDLPDASDVATLRDFTDIEAGRIAEHFLYLGALVLFSLELLVLHRLLRRAHTAAALFGTAVASSGFVVLIASSVLHVSTAPLAELRAAATSPADVQAIEAAWHGAQSVFDTMLATGVLLVPAGVVLLGVAMLRARQVGAAIAWTSVALGAVGVVGAVVAIVDPGSMASALAVLAIVLFALVTGWRLLRLGRDTTIDLTDARASVTR